ncbi:MAG: AMP-binding protein [Methanomassiliicoccaceae archaeon]|jgi:phenylacetate-CoA ligase|nr:AMP-binding protein [Methanomassiliicoccaceae archaeon]
MGALESIKLAIVRRKLLTRKIQDGTASPLEEWIRLKAVEACRSNKELMEKIGSHDLEKMSREDFQEYQLFMFRKQMRYAEENSPFYREHFKKEGVRPEDIRTYGDLENVPFTLPSDLAAEPMNFYAVSRTKMAREFTTTGTTGTRKSIGYTTRDMIGKVDIIAAVLKGTGMTSSDSIHILFPAIGDWDPSLMVAGACRIAGYRSSICSSSDVDEQYRMMKENGTTFLIGLPSFIYRITVIMGKVMDLRALGIKKVISSSEPMSETMRSALEDAWGCKVLDIWGMTEIGLGCAIECDEQDNMHADEANLMFEIIDPVTGRHIQNGAVGELVVSTLTAEGTPIIRYRTRDLMAIFDPPCACGSIFNRKLSRPVGRMDLQFKVGMGYKIFPLMFDDILFSNPEVVDYRLKITKESFRDVLTFEVESTDKSDALARRIVSAVSSIMEIADGIADDLIDTPRTEFIDIGSIEYRAAKAKKIIDMR